MVWTLAKIDILDNIDTPQDESITERSRAH